jgi:uncharacterized protein (DUF302 family)
MKTIGTYAIEVTTRLPFEEAIARITTLLGEEGFGVLTEIDVRATLQKKLGIDTKPYRILGACNPGYARRALESNAHMGVLLPCNVVVWDEGAHRVVAAMEPIVMSEVVGTEEIRRIAQEVSTRIHRALERLG